jgi:triosephosphate isomerase (TIM)
MPDQNKAPQQRRGSASPRSASSGRRPLVAANWKMHKTVAETEHFLDRFVGSVEDLGGVDLVVCPPSTALAAAAERTRRTTIRVAAQNVHEQDSGAFTGEISIPMLRELGVAGAIVGHSERRELFCETDEALARKVPALLAAELLPILCVGESEAERDAGKTEAVLTRQVDADLSEVPDPKLAGVVIAYEPIWAIGTGRTATTEQAQEAIALIRSRVAARDPEVAAEVRIVYGGSVKPGNAADLFAQPDVDGGLVGGASLDPDDFLAICEAASR